MDDNELLLFCDMERENIVKAYAAAVPTAPFFEVTDNEDEYYAIPSNWIKYLTSQVVEVYEPINPFEALKTFAEALNRGTQDNE